MNKDCEKKTKLNENTLKNCQAAESIQWLNLTHFFCTRSNKNINGNAMRCDADA